MGFDPIFLEHNFSELANILEIVSVLLGVVLFVGAMFQFKRYGEMRTFMSHQMTIAKPMMMMLAAVCFFTLPTILELLLNGMWGTSSPLAYTGSGGWHDIIPPILMFVRIIGVGSVMRGLMHLSRAGGQGGQPGLIGRAMIHIVAGVLCIHVMGTLHLLGMLIGVY